MADHELVWFDPSAGLTNSPALGSRGSCWALDDRHRLWLTQTAAVTAQAIARTLDFQIAPARLLRSIARHTPVLIPDLELLFHEHHQGRQDLDEVLDGKLRTNPIYVDGQLHNAIGCDVASTYSYDAVLIEERWIAALTPQTDEPRWLRTGDGSPGLVWP
ncbi:hypothetical protein AAFP35_25785 [Gordonia sp. CPCC 206044]|uniref:hypothetical protein n=1 Tax=Gordonia sp. CPCC 206044 TaxID=3140793 RepID=UPI003AF39E01